MLLLWENVLDRCYLGIILEDKYLTSAKVYYIFKFLWIQPKRLQQILFSWQSVDNKMPKYKILKVLFINCRPNTGQSFQTDLYLSFNCLVKTGYV